MSFCFATGSQRDSDGRPLLRVLHSLEYVSFDLEKEVITVTCDFLVRNCSEQPTSLRGLHRGNICWRDATNEWVQDTYWTKVLLDLAGEAIGLAATDEAVVLCHAGAPPCPVDLLPTPPKVAAWGPVAPDDGRYVHFTGWVSPKVGPGQHALFRITGQIVGDTYEHLLPGSGKGDPIGIVGGEPLQEEIWADLKNSPSADSEAYEEPYRDFQSNYLDAPEMYHVFFERLGGGSLKPVRMSTDVRKGCENYPVDGRHISWYWSDVAFSIYAKANGPVLSLVPC